MTVHQKRNTQEYGHPRGEINGMRNRFVSAGGKRLSCSHGHEQVSSHFTSDLGGVCLCSCVCVRVCIVRQVDASSLMV